MMGTEDLDKSQPAVYHGKRTTVGEGIVQYSYTVSFLSVLLLYFSQKSPKIQPVYWRSFTFTSQFI